MISSEREKSQIPRETQFTMPEWAYKEDKNLSDLVFSIVVGDELVLLIVDKPDTIKQKIRSFRPDTLQEIKLPINFLQTFRVGLYTRGITANQLREKNNGHKS